MSRHSNRPNHPGRHVRTGASLLVMVVLAGSAGTGAWASAAVQPPATPPLPLSPKAQPSPSTKPVRRGKTVKQPIVDLEKQATERRTGQVLPGDPPREKFAPPIAEPKPVAPAVPMSDPSGGTPAGGVKPAPAPISPDAGPRPLPKPSEAPAPSAEPKTQPAPSAAPSSPAPAPAEPKKPEASRADPLRAAAPAATSSGESVAALPMLRGPAGREATTAPVGSTGRPVSVSVDQISGPAAGVQWRMLTGGSNGGWQVADGRVEGRIEIRTGLDNEVLLTVGDSAGIRIGRLSRVIVEGGVRSGIAAPAVRVIRGSVEVVPTAAQSVEPTICCPDRFDGFAGNPGCRVSYSAFKGTRIESVRMTRTVE